MKRQLKILLVFLLLLVIAGCNSTNDDKNYTIKFESYSDGVYEDIVIQKAQTVSLPTPTRQGFKFIGWYPSDKYVEGTEVTSNTTIGKDITLYAKWETIEIKVELDLNGGHADEELETLYNIKATEEINLPKLYKDNHLFVGWFNGSEKVSNKISFLADTLLTAKFISMVELEESYQVELELNGGHYYDFDKKLSDDIMNSREYRYMENDSVTVEINNLHYDFVMDYATFLSMPYSASYIKWDIFNQTYNRLIGNTGFFSDNNFYAKWLWLIQYLEFLADDVNKPHLKELYENNYMEDNGNYFTESACIRIELAGFMYVGTEIYGDNMFVSHNYTQEELMNIKNYFNISSYQIGKETPILSPIKEGYIFRGWYDNPDFLGEPIWKIEDNWYGNIKLYAKWEEI